MPPLGHDAGRMTFDDLSTPFNRRTALAGGRSRRELDEAVRVGDVVRAHRDVYARPRPLLPDEEEWERTRALHLDRLRATLMRLPGHVASHTSAALVHGLAVVVAPTSPVEVTAVERCPRSRREPGLTMHHSDSHDIPVTEVDGVRTTDLLRTVADTLRTRTLAHGTALLDDVLRRGLVCQDEVVAALTPMLRWRGRPRALVAIELSDARRESWLESYSDVVLYERGVPLPLPQVPIFDGARRFVGRVDGLDPEVGIFREADGLGKYFLGVAAGASAEESALSALGAERARHQRLESLGLRGVRWTSDEVHADPDSVADRVKSLRRAPVPAISGYAEWDGELRRLPFVVERREIDLERAHNRRGPGRRTRR